MPLEVICRGCGKPYTPSKDDVLSGVYRLCPSCRNPPATTDRPIEPAAA